MIQAAGVPFSPGQGMVFVSQGSPTGLYEAIQEPGTNSAGFFPVGPVQTITYNALGFNPSDMYIYAINSTTNRLIQIDSTGATTGLGAARTVTNLPALSGSNTYNAGSIGNCSPANILWVAPSQSSSTIYGIDVTAAQPTAVPLHLTAGNIGTTSLPNTADFVCMDGFLWGVYGGGGPLATSPGNGIYRVNISTGQMDWFSLAGIVSTDWGNSFGAQWLYGNGNLGISNNVTGSIHQIQIDNPGAVNPTFTEVAVLAGPASSTNDGASYQGLPVDLSLTKTSQTEYNGIDPTEYAPGANIAYTLTVTNESSVQSSGFYVTDTLDPQLTNISFDSSDCYLSDVNIAVCVSGTLNPGVSKSFTITATTPLGINTSVTNTATVTGYEADPDPDNNTASVTNGSATSGYIISKAAELGLAGHHVRPGDTVTYTITVQNTGETDYDSTFPATFSDDLSDVLDDADLVYPLAPGLTLNGSSLDWTGELAAGATTTVSYAVVIHTADLGGNRVLSNTVLATHDEGSCGGSCQTQTLVGDPGYTITKKVDAAEAKPGDLVTYEIAIKNTGTSPYTSHHPVTITDDLSDVLDDAVFVGSITSGAYISGSILTWSGPLAVGGTANISYTVRVMEPGAGNGVMNNRVVPSDSEGICAVCTVQTKIIVPPIIQDLPVSSPGHSGHGSRTSASNHDCTAAAPSDPAPYIYQATSSKPGTITLHFNTGGEPFDQYLLEYGLTGQGFNFGVIIEDPRIGSFTVNDLTPGQTYQFRLTPLNGCASGPVSNTFPVGVGLPKVPGVPNTGYKK